MLSKLVLAFALVAFLATASAYKVDVGTATVANTPFQHAGSAVSWYNYNVVHGSSSSTPHSVEVKDTMVVSVVKAGDNKHYVAVINDIPNDQNGGSATLKITCGKGPSGTDTDLFNDCRQALVNVVQHDDPAEYLSETSPGSGIFTVSWGWASCCTDGIMVGPFNDENVDMYFQLIDHDTGITGLRIASQVNGQTEHTSTFGSTEVVHIYGALEGGEPPVVNCQPPSPAISWGDPHFTTFDGRRYNYQGRGAHMFCLAGGVEIQVCHEPWRNNNRASVNRAVAFNAGDETVVLFYDTTHNIHINGVDAGLACGSTHTFVDGSVFSRSSSCNSLTYTSNTGYRLAITMRAQHFDIQFHAPSSGLTGSLGLCGYGDCDSSNDFTNPAGDVVTGINEFGTSWQLGNALRESLFGSSFTCGEPDVPEPPIEGPICGTEPHPVCDCCAEIEDPVLKEDCAFDALVAFQALTADGVDETAALDQVCEELEIPTCDPECRGGCEDGVCVCATGSAPECLAPNEGFDCGCKKASASSETNKVYLTFVEGGVCPANNP